MVLDYRVGVVVAAVAVGLGVCAWRAVGGELRRDAKQVSPERGGFDFEKMSTGLVLLCVRGVVRVCAATANPEFVRLKHCSARAKL